MLRRAVPALLVAALCVQARAESQTEAAIDALRKDSSLKVRTQAAIVLGQRGAIEAVPALREAVASDDASAVRLAAIGALGKLRDRSARSTLRLASEADPDDAVRKAAAKVLQELGPAVFTIEEARGSATAAARRALRDAIAKHLRDRGFTVVDDGGMRLKPSIRDVAVDSKAGKTVIAVTATLVAVEDDGRMAAMLEGGARLSASGTIPESKLGAYSARALDAAARTLCEDLAAKLGER